MSTETNPVSQPKTVRDYLGISARGFLMGSADVVPGWASTVLPMLFLGGVQLLSIGVVGEYVGKIYSTVQQRPRWIEWQRLDGREPALRRDGRSA